jgi:hypothetical protein
LESRSGRLREVWTAESGVQPYTSPLDAQNARGRFGFFGRETQHFPDPVNHPQVSYSTRMRPTGDLNRFFPK